MNYAGKHFVHRVAKRSDTVTPLLFLICRILETEAYLSERFAVGFGLGYP
jgi:hypothetical protein